MYAGMDIEYCKDRSVEILMKLYLLKVIDEFEEFGKNITSSKPTPAAVYLFNVDETATLLNDQTEKRFHKIVAKMLLVCCRERPDINVTIPFLTTRISKSNEGD